MISLCISAIGILGLYHGIRGHRRRRALRQMYKIAIGKLTTGNDGRHKKALSQENPKYIQRVKVNHVAWEVEDKEYAAPIWTHPDVLANSNTRVADGHQWADPPNVVHLHRLQGRVTFLEDGTYPCELVLETCPETLAPLNPHGRTGLAGRGLLGKWGPNHAGDPVVTRSHPTTGKLQVAMITRGDNDMKALPGGMVDPHELVWVTIRREFTEEAGAMTDPERKAKFEKLSNDLFKHGTVLYRGYVDDPRNTDNAWMETTAMHYHCDPYIAENLPLEAGDDAKAVEWLDVTFENLVNIYSPTHRHFIELAQKRLENSQSGPPTPMS